jgi:hypothetical protein
MTAVMEHSRLSSTAYLVLLVIANHEGDKDGEAWAWPSIDRLRREARCSDRTVIRAIQQAELAGELHVERGAGPGGVHLYRVLLGKGGDTVTPPSVGGGAIHGPRVSPKPKELLGSSSSVSSSSSHSTSRRRDAAADARFADFWAVYPLRKDVGHARTAFRNACRRADPDTIIAGAARYRDDPTRDPEHTKYAQGWLNGERWLDEAIDPQAAALRILQGGTG